MIAPYLDASAVIYLIEGSVSLRAQSPRLSILDLSTAVLDRATELRAHHGFKVPDAIHLATAIEAGADAFLTGDAGLMKCPGLNVELLSP